MRRIRSLLPRRGRRRRAFTSSSKYLFLSVIAFLVILVPLWLVVVNSVKSQTEAGSVGLGLPRHWRFGNFTTVLNQGHLLHGLANTVLATFPSVFLVLLFGSFASWVFARARSRALRGLYYISIIGILLPPAVVTTVLVLRWVHLFGSFFGLILFYVGVYLSFAIFFITGFIKTIPIELEEAARIDGAGPFRIFRKIVLPLLHPVLTTTFIVVLLIIWNDFFYPFFILTQPTQNTLTLGLYSFVQGNLYETRWNLIFADVILTSLPLIVVYFFAQRRIMSGIMGGAVK